MENYDFFMENLRFHLYKENIVVFRGWYREDNPHNRYLEVYLDSLRLEILYENKKGIHIRQRYMRYNADVNEEINAEIKLPENWKQAGKLKIYCINGEKKSLIMSIKTERLAKREHEIFSSIETKQLLNGKLVIKGWAVAKGEVFFTITDKAGKKLDTELNRSYRRDAAIEFPEIEKEYVAGFQVTVPMELPQPITFTLSHADEKTSIHWNVRDITRKEERNNILFKTIKYYQKYGFRSMLKKVKSKLTNLRKVDEYKIWQKRHTITQEEILMQKNTTFEYMPKFSIVVPLYRTKISFLRELLESVMNQSYSNWELCLADGTENESSLLAVSQEYTKKDARIKYNSLSKNRGISENTNAAIQMATGDFIVFVDHDDTLAPNALYEFAKALNEDRNTEIIYSDEDKLEIDGNTYFEPHFKSDFNIDLLCSMNYICHLFAVKKEIINQVGMLRTEFDGAQDYDFILRCVEVTQNIKHIPKILYHWRCHSNSTSSNPESKMYAFEAGRKAVEEHYKRIGVPAKVEHGQYYGIYKTKFLWKEKPLISIVIPNKDHRKELKKCIDSIEEKSTYRNFEFVIIENNSTEQETFDYYKEIEQKENTKVVFYKEEFNYSKINNFGVEHTKGDYILLLNNDTMIINPDCLEEMLGYCMREDVGIVGARLYYEDDTIQHAGVILGLGGMAGHAFVGMSRYENGYFSRIICAQDYSAVTAACLMTKKEIYQKVHGLTEELQVAFNDIDYCMKVRELGKLVVYNPAAELYHYESKSRGKEDTPEKVERFNSEVDRFTNRWRKELEEGDPYYNPNFALNRADFALKI